MRRELEERSTGATAAAVKGVLLPGVAGIAMFLLLLTLLNVFAALKGVYGGGRARDGVLVLCTLLVAGVFGLLRMRRWGWAIVTAGALLLGGGYLLLWTRTHAAPLLVQALFGFCFFLYLVRAEVRDRLR